MLVFLIIPILYVIIYKKKERFTNMETVNYTKYSDTLPTIPKKDKSNYIVEINGNLDQCKKKCNVSEDCIGFIRENKGGDLTQNKCGLIKNVINCHNEYKEPSEKYYLNKESSSHIKPDKYYNYDTYFKVDLDEKSKDNIQKCIILNNKISLIHKKFPFSYIILDKNNQLKIIKNELLVPNLKDETEVKEHSKKCIFEMVKGLTGNGISFKINKFDEDYYLTYNFNNEYITSKRFEDNYVFRENSTFKIEMKYSEEVIKDNSEVRYVSIYHTKKGNKSFWNLNNTTNRIIMSPENEDLKDKNDLLFEIVTPVDYNRDEVIELEINTPGPSVDNSTIEKSEIDLNQKESDLEKLELNIREAQNKQNIKLMNIMLDVNKFKLHDLSMNNFLNKCVRTSSVEVNSEAEKYIDKKFKGNIN